jgi:GH25 family lysozyme M1 (1,4-beta-N-acetylmuramidase)
MKFVQYNQIVTILQYTLIYASVEQDPERPVVRPSWAESLKVSMAVKVIGL